MTTAGKEFADPRKPAFIRGYEIFRNAPGNAQYVVSSIDSFQFTYLFPLIDSGTIPLPLKLHSLNS